MFDSALFDQIYFDGQVGATVNLTAADGLKMAEVLAALNDLSPASTDGLTVGEVIAALTSPMPTATDGVVLSETLAALVNPMPEAADGLKIGSTAKGIGQYYNAGDSGSANIYGDRWGAQTFTPANSTAIASVKLLLYRLGSPGTLTVGIKATDVDGKPTGDDLCSNTTNGNTLTTDGNGEWREIVFPVALAPVGSTKYAIVIRGAADVDNRVMWRADTVGSTYAGGDYVFSLNAGSTWTINTDIDFMFETWGVPYTPIAEVALSPAATDGVVFSESLSPGLILYSVSADGFKLGEELSPGLVLPLTLTDGSVFGDSISASLLVPLTLLDGVKLSEVLAPLIDLSASAVDAMVIGDVLAVTVEAGEIVYVFLTVQDGLKMGEALTGPPTISQTVTDGFKHGDTVAWALNVNPTATDGLKLSDTPLLLVTLSPSTADGVIFSDVAPFGSAPVYYFSITEGLKMGEVVTTLVTLTQALVDGTKFSDLPSLGNIKWLWAADGLKMGDSTRQRLPYVSKLSRPDPFYRMGEPLSTHDLGTVLKEYSLGKVKDGT